MRTIEKYLPDHPFFEGLDAPALALVAGCATNISLAPHCAIASSSSTGWKYPLSHSN